jgi:putative hydrolase of the HAD superfamily
VRAVVFDFFGTLTDPGVEVGRKAAYASTGAALGLDPAAFWAAMTESFTERTTGVLGDTRSTLRLIARRCGVEVDAATCEAALRQHLAAYPAVLRPHPAAVDVLTELGGRGFRIGLLSDCSSELVESWESTPFAALVESAVFSFDIGVRKPAPVGYRTVARSLGVDPAACWFVGDGGSKEHTGAHEAGMRSVLVTNAHYAVERLRADADTFVPPDVIADLADLPALVGSPS